MNTKKLGDSAESVHIVNNSSIHITTVVSGELKVAQVKDSRDEMAGLSNMMLEKPDSLEHQLKLLKAICIIILDTVVVHPSPGMLAEILVLSLVNKMEMLVPLFHH